MNDLSNNVYDYYLGHFAELSPDKQLHFASRLYLWSGDERCAEHLRQLRAGVTLGDDPGAALREVYNLAQTTIHHGSKNAAAERAPHFERYPELRSVVMVLFRLTFLRTVYGIDARGAFYDLYPAQTLDDLQQRLLADRQAMAILSTHAINFLYLYNRVLLDDDTSFDPSQLLDLARIYDFSRPVHLQLFIYLYTHCVIGESQFYARRVPETYRPIYDSMLAALEKLIDARYDDINLDNKFEYLVCCGLLGVDSPLRARIDDEARRSIADEGMFLVDRHNNNPQITNHSLDLSEHRNVLYILANQPFQPSGVTL